ncbi:hypothetical protein [Psychroflexus aestuariivivens]|uniref:hypothetical protein n=1 Tax=Psychroflexus aestuariivivens TaxID=1795040 RepID=UPI000FD76697|nr:hypothetical protein [Psychroflexus aestuariivivens]
MKLTQEFKEALSGLPEKEKDKLIFRLIKKDNILLQRLFFELVDDENQDEKRKQLENKIKDRVAYMKRTFYSPGTLMMDLRYLSGEITEHTKVTKDKFGEPYLNLIMLKEVLKQLNPDLTRFSPGKTHKFDIYVVNRTFKIMILVSKLHEDLMMEFEPLMLELSRYFGQNQNLMHAAIHNGLDVNWLAHFNIPEDIQMIQRDLRNQGFLR